MLVIDDLGSQSATPWAQEKLFQLFDHRYNAQLPTVITMTRDVDLDPRLKTRIMDTTRCRILEITVPSYRGEGRSSPPPKPRSSPSPARGRRGLGVAR